MASESLGKDWGLSQEEALQAHGELVLGFVRCLPKLGPRSEIGPILAAVLRSSSLFQSFSDRQRGYLWERCYKLLDAVYPLAEAQS